MVHKHGTSALRDWNKCSTAGLGMIQKLQRLTTLLKHSFLVFGCHSIAVPDQLFRMNWMPCFFLMVCISLQYFQLDSVYRSMRLCLCPKVVRHAPGRIFPD
jgi:hypothetical protein